jgi:hypothetical protein
MKSTIDNKEQKIVNVTINIKFPERKAAYYIFRHFDSVWDVANYKYYDVIIRIDDIGEEQALSLIENYKNIKLFDGLKECRFIECAYVVGNKTKYLISGDEEKDCNSFKLI